MSNNAKNVPQWIILPNYGHGSNKIIKATIKKRYNFIEREQIIIIQFVNTCMAISYVHDNY